MVHRPIFGAGQGCPLSVHRKPFLSGFSYAVGDSLIIGSDFSLDATDSASYSADAMLGSPEICQSAAEFMPDSTAWLLVSREPGRASTDSGFDPPDSWRDRTGRARGSVAPELPAAAAGGRRARLPRSAACLGHWGQWVGRRPGGRLFYSRIGRLLGDFLQRRDGRRGARAHERDEGGHTLMAGLAC